MLTLGSLFDGIGGWQLAAIRNGIKPLWSSEIDPFCCQITQRHFSDTVQLGDINSIDADLLPHVDIITAGSPCQDLSIAGKRSGLHASRSGLFFKATDIVRRINPQFFVWENVSGVFSSNAGNDFRAVLEEILQESVPLPRYWSNAGLVDGRHVQVCWRVLDAQFWGVPQRRRRIFLVADFTARRAAKILFESAGLLGYPATSESQKRDITTGTGTTADSSVFSMQRKFDHSWLIDYDKAYTLNTYRAPQIGQTTFCIQGNTIERQPKNGGDVAPTVSAMYGTGGNNTPLVAYGIDRATFNQGANAQFKPNITPEISSALTARGPSAVAQNIIRRLTPLECERLQGLPDEWTQGTSDTHRYKALGNGMAQPCADWILKRIVEVTS